MFKRFLPVLIAVLALALPAAYAITPNGTNSENQNMYMKVGYELISVENALTAAAGGGQTNAYQLAASFSRFTTVASAADSAKLMNCSTALVGMQVTVANAHASNAMAVFPASGEAINLLSANASISVPNTKAMTFVCVSNALWQSVLSG